MLSLPDAFSVRVNGELISSLCIENRVREKLSSMSGDNGFGALDLEFIRLREVEGLIEGLLLVQHARSRGLFVEESVLREEILRRRDSVSDTVDYGSDEFVDSVHNEMLIGLLLVELSSDLLSLDDSYLEEYYESNKEYFSCGEAVYVRHILFEFCGDEAGDGRMKDRALSLLGRIRGGEDFVYLAKEFSHCPSAGRGGDLGYVYRGSLGDTDFEDALFLLEENSVSDVIESNFGYHIVELLGRVNSFVPPFVSIRSRVRNFIVENANGERVENLLEELWSKASIKYMGI